MFLVLMLACGIASSGGVALDYTENPAFGHYVMTPYAFHPKIGHKLVATDYVDIGQGLSTALAQIVAEELQLALCQVQMQPARTGLSPDEAVTSGSLSIQESGTALRWACAEVRALYLAAAARRWRKARVVPPSWADSSCCSAP